MPHYNIVFQGESATEGDIDWENLVTIRRTGESTGAAEEPWHTAVLRVALRQTRMRLFVGIRVPEEIANTLRTMVPDGARRVHAADMHITLFFLGEVQEHRLPCVREQLQVIRRGAFALRVTGLGTFARAGVLFAEVEPSPELVSLQAELAEGMVRCGFAPEARQYHPHITLSRDRALARRPPPDLELDLRFDAEAVVLFQSRAIEAPSRYMQLDGVALS